MTSSKTTWFKSIKDRIRARINTVILETHSHFTCLLPKNQGSFTYKSFKLLFSGIRSDKDQIENIRNLPEDAIVVYATRYKSYFEYLFYHTRYQEIEVSPPEVGFDHPVFLLQPISRIFKMFVAYTDHFFQYFSLPDPYDSGYIREELLNKKTALVSLVEKKGFYLRFVKSNPDPLRYLIEMQRSVDRPVYIIPHLMFFSKNPQKSVRTLGEVLFGTEEKPGKIRRFYTLFQNPGKVFIEISEPVNLKEFLNLPENRGKGVDHLSLSLRRWLLSQMNRHRQSITGPLMKSREEVKENILTNERLRDFMGNYAESKKIPIYKVRKKAEGYLDEIAAKLSYSVIRVFSAAVQLLANTMFEDIIINTAELNKVKSMSQRGPVVLVACHKSHIDYLILSYVMHQNNMPCPHIAAGKNLSFWPLGPIFRGGGAFFIRRSFRGAVLYSKVFSEYIYNLLEEGHNVEFFIEGGRSRTGKLLKPKLGLLSILLNNFKEGASEDMIFAPVYVGYDRVLEEDAYLHEIEGGKKKPENLLQVFKARKFLKKRYGKIYIRFHEPFSINDLLAQSDESLQDMNSKQMNGFIRSLGYRLLNNIDQVTVVTPYAIVASALLCNSKRHFSYNSFVENVETYMSYIFAIDARLSDTMLIDYNHAIDFVFKSYRNQKFIEPVTKKSKNDTSTQIMYLINDSKRPILDYYKNNSIIFFIPAAFTSMAILEKDAFQFSASELEGSYRFLREFFINEFAYDVDRSPEYFIRQTIDIFTKEAIIMPHPELPDSYNLTSVGFRKLKLFSSFLRTYFESYWIVLNVFMRYPKSFLNAKNRLKKAQSMGNRMLRRKQLDRTEALSKMNYKNAIDFFTSHGVKGSDDSQQLEFYKTKIKKYIDRLSS
ncbi:1-acyl-sn-glycerol-3-phosphate acyltransferase [Desulfobacterales bacterium HSG16]|nr:1-acyl-sn-glycerol-3-phosphate acyltransferase [Desulfobacterales bacterium HSG16]